MTGNMAIAQENRDPDSPRHSCASVLLVAEENQRSRVNAWVVLVSI